MRSGFPFMCWFFAVGILTVAASVSSAGEGNQSGDPPAENPVPARFIVYLVTETSSPEMSRLAPKDYQSGILATWIEVFVPEYGVAYRLGQDTILKVELKRYEGIWTSGRYGKRTSFSRLEWLTLTETAATEILRKCQAARDRESIQSATPEGAGNPRP